MPPKNKPKAQSTLRFSQSVDDRDVTPDPSGTPQEGVSTRRRTRAASQQPVTPTPATRNQNALSPATASASGSQNTPRRSPRNHDQNKSKDKGKRKADAITIDDDDNDSETLRLPPPKKKTKMRTAWVYKHMRGFVDMQHIFLNAKGKPEWRCAYCLQDYQITGGTSNMAKHLFYGHGGLKEDSPADFKVKNIHHSIQEAMRDAENNPHKRRRLNQNESTAIPINPDTLEILFVRFIAVCNQPLRLVECKEFRALLTYLNGEVDKFLVTDHKSVSKWVMRQYEVERKKVKERLQRFKTKIHIATDLWTSPNHHALMVVIGQGINEDGELERVVLDFTEVEGRHTGDNLSTYMLSVLEDWDIIHKLGWFVMDNAENNDTMLKKLCSDLLRQHNKRFDYQLHRIRCMGHILNLSVNSFLWVTNTEDLEAEDFFQHSYEDIQATEDWRRKGPLGVMHNVVVHAQQNSQRLQVMENLADGRRPVRDNKTRWSSWSRMLRVNTKPPVDEAIHQYLDIYCRRPII